MQRPTTGTRASPVKDNVARSMCQSRTQSITLQLLVHTVNTHPPQPDVTVGPTRGNTSATTVLQMYVVARLSLRFPKHHCRCKWRQHYPSSSAASTYKSYAHAS